MLTPPIELHEDPASIMARRFGIVDTTHGAAFSAPFKAFAVGIVVAIAYWAQQANAMAVWGVLATQAKLLMAGCALLVLYTLYHVMRSTTSVSPTQIKQSFVFNRHVHLGEITFAKFIYIPYLTWLIAPRLFVRTAGNQFAAFYGASHELHRVFGQIHRTVSEGSK